MNLFDYLGDSENSAASLVVIPGKQLHLTSIRLDCFDTSKNRQFLTSIVGKFNPKFFLFCHEIGQKTGKHHYQGILYYENELFDKDRTAHRNWIKRNLPDDKSYAAAYYTGLKKIQKISYTKCKVREKLESYVLKDGKLVYTNIPKMYLDSVPDWVDKDNFKVRIQEILDEHELTHKGFCIELIKAHMEAGKCPPTRNMLYKYLLQSHRLSYSSYLSSINMYLCEEDA